MKVLVCNPPWLKGDMIGHRAGARFPCMEKKIGPTPSFIPYPFFLGYTSALLKRQKFEVRFVDSVVEGHSNEDFFNICSEFSPSVTIMETSTSSVTDDLAIMEEVKRRVPASRILLCGPHVFFNGREILERNDCIDAGIFGEYEFTALEVCEILRDGKWAPGSLAGVKGLYYRTASGEVAQTAGREMVGDLDSLPYPDRDDVSIKKYYAISMLKTPQVQMVASRGCPYRCIFCSWPATMYGYKYRYRDPVKVADEMEYLYNRHGFRNFYFFDDCFLNVKKSAEIIAGEILKRKMRLSWVAQSRADGWSRDVLLRLKESGFKGGLMGVESGSPIVQEKIGKLLDLKKVRETIRDYNALGLEAHLTFTLGLPGETRETIEETLRFAKACDPYSAQFSITVPYPGTKLYKDLKEEGYLLDEDWSNYDAYQLPAFRTEALSPQELYDCHKRLLKEWDRFNVPRRIYRNFFEFFKRGIRDPWRSFLLLKRTVQDLM